MLLVIELAAPARNRRLAEAAREGRLRTMPAVKEYGEAHPDGIPRIRPAG
jgi:hypothetical protein